MEKKKNFNMNVHGIKCDACDYKDMTVKMEEYPQYLDKPCPECGANLLTKADYNTLKALIRLTKVLNFIFPSKKTDENAEPIILKGTANGSGTIAFERLKNTSEGCAKEVTHE